jgi:hypothetical protein
MRRAVLRSLGVALVVLAVHQTVTLGDFLAFCAHHRAWRRIVDKQSTVVLDAGTGVARAGDAIYTCAIRHCFGLLICHDDLLCICAPATLGASQVATLSGGACVVDKAYPSRYDRAGACQRARCDDHIGP